MKRHAPAGPALVILAIGLLVLVMLAGCAGWTRDGLSVKRDLAPAVTSYWVPMVAPDGLVYEVEIMTSDVPGGRAIVCVPAPAQYTVHCLAKVAEGYTYVDIRLEP